MTFFLYIFFWAVKFIQPPIMMWAVGFLVGEILLWGQYFLFFLVCRFTLWFPKRLLAFYPWEIIVYGKQQITHRQKIYERKNDMKQIFKYTKTVWSYALIILLSFKGLVVFYMNIKLIKITKILQYFFMFLILNKIC